MKQVKLKFLVIKGSAQTIIGCQDSLKHGIISISRDCVEENEVQ